MQESVSSAKTDFISRMVRAAKLEVALYEEVEADRSATGQALGVVVLAGLATAIGSPQVVGIGSIIVRTLGGVLEWYLLSTLMYVIGTRVLREPQTEADPGEMLRTIGFAHAPAIICVVGVVMPTGLIGVVFLAAMVWTLVAVFIAVRQALDYESTLRAIGVYVITVVVVAVALQIVFVLLGIPLQPV